MSATRWLCAATLALSSACAQPPRPQPPRPQTPAPPGKLRVRVTLSDQLATKPVSGRLLVLMSSATKPTNSLRAGVEPGSPWIAGFDVDGLEPGGTVDVDLDRHAWPRPLSQASPGSYQWQAVLDVDGDYPYRWRATEGDLYGLVVRESIHAAGSDIRLTLSRRAAADQPEPRDSNYVSVEHPSALLSAFWKKPIVMRAVVALPPDAQPGTRYPGVYFVHGFGGNARSDAKRYAAAAMSSMAAGRQKQKVLVFLDGSSRT